MQLDHFEIPAILNHQPFSLTSFFNPAIQTTIIFWSPLRVQNIEELFCKNPKKEELKDTIGCSND